MPRKRPGFTLIELLVVIAIIAILAAILFPVFAGVRERAKMTSCASNAKNIGTAVMQYHQSYDDYNPIFFTNGPPRSSWVGQIQPYAKSFVMFKCPNMPDATDAQGRSIWTTPGFAVVDNLSLWEGYAWNVDYMNFSADCSDFDVNGRSGPPINMSRVQRPAETIMAYGCALAPGSGSFAGSNSLYPPYGGYFFGTSPAIETTPEGCAFANSGWGQGSFNGPYGGWEQPRHQDQGGNGLFCDGHVRTMTAGQAAAGTNWNPNLRNTQIVVKDRNQYLWDLQ